MALLDKIFLFPQLFELFFQLGHLKLCASQLNMRSSIFLIVLLNSLQILNDCIVAGISQLCLSEKITIIRLGISNFSLLLLLRLLGVLRLGSGLFLLQSRRRVTANLCRLLQLGCIGPSDAIISGVRS